MDKNKFEEIKVKQTSEGVDVPLPLKVVDDLGFQKLKKGPIEFGSGKSKVTMHLADDDRAEGTR